MRFPGFEGEWEEYINEHLFSISKEKNKSLEYHTVLSASQTEGMVERDSLGIDIKYEAESVSGYKVVRPGEYVIHLRSFQGGFAFSDKTGICSPAYTILHPKEVLSYGFLKEYFMSQKFIDSLRLVTYGIRDGKSIFVEEWMKLKTYIPKSHKEQERIKEFLGLIDKRLTIQNKVIEDLKKLKSAFCEKMYDESNPNTRLADIIEQQSIRNKAGEDLKVLSVSNRYGFVKQSEQFEDRTIASEDTSNYKIVALNDFAYNPARINVGSIARLKNFENGIVSPMYICFRCKGSVLPEFLEPFFSTKYFSLEMGKRLEGSVRMCLSFEGLCNIPINIPSYEEQTETAKKVNALSEKLRLEESYSILLSAQKEYILSQMFI